MQDRETAGTQASDQAEQAGTREHQIETPWFYSVSELPPLITVDEFNRITGGVMSATSSQLEAKIAGVSAAIRDWCGWHVSPVLDCSITTESEGNLLVLPVMFLREIDRFEVQRSACEVQFKSNGLVRLAHGFFPDAWASIECDFKAGVESAVLAEIVAQIASNALVAAPGIAEEHAGSVGATYNKTGDGITGGVSLLARDKELLMHYRLGTWQ